MAYRVKVNGAAFSKVTVKTAGLPADGTDNLTYFLKPEQIPAYNHEQSIKYALAENCLSSNFSVCWFTLLAHSIRQSEFTGRTTAPRPVGCCHSGAAAVHVPHRSMEESNPDSNSFCGCRSFCPHTD